MAHPLLESFMQLLKSSGLDCGLNEAIALAALAHAGQKDKGDAPYIAHPMRVMLEQKDEQSMTVAALHDVLEDVPDVSAEDLQAIGFSEDIVAAIKLVTRHKDESYESFVHRIGQSRDKKAITVKVADLCDNANLDRIKNPKAKDRKRVAKYKEAILILGTSPYWDCVSVDSKRERGSRMILETYKDKREYPNAILSDLRMALSLAHSQHAGMREEFARQLKELCIPYVFSKKELAMVAAMLEGQQPIGHRPRLAPTEKKIEARRAFYLRQLLYAMAGHATHNGRILARRACGAKQVSVAEVAADLLNCSQAKFNTLISYATKHVTPIGESELLRVSEHFAQKERHEIGRGADAVFEYCTKEILIG